MAPTQSGAESHMLAWRDADFLTLPQVLNTNTVIQMCQMNPMMLLMQFLIVLVCVRELVLLDMERLGSACAAAQVQSS